MSDIAQQPDDDRKKASARRERLKFLARGRRNWRRIFVDSVDQVAVLAKVDDESGLTGRYIFMTLMSAGIAILGLLQSSPAVVIGAMLLSPLMGPIIGSGFALAVGDSRELRRCGKTLAVGTVLAIGISAIIVFFSPIQTVTAEIAARTRPNLFDLLIALFSALAGAYAMLRGREGTIVGVAIATALMPPLAVVGFGLATFNWTVFGGSLMLFITNLMTIALSAAVMARLYGFSTRLTKKQTMRQVAGILTAFLVLALPLGYSLRQIAWEANAQRQANSIIRGLFDDHARVAQVDIDYDAEPVAVTATVMTPSFRTTADAEASARLSAAMGSPFDVKLEQFQVGNDPGAAEAAELASARAREQDEARARQISNITNNLALMAGISPDAVIIDSAHQRAIANARPIPGADLQTYRALESRVAADSKDWRIELRPPTSALPDVPFNAGEVDANALSLCAWAASRSDLPIRLSGPTDEVEQVRAAMIAAGVSQDRISVEQARGSSVSVRWVTP